MGTTQQQHLRGRMRPLQPGIKETASRSTFFRNREVNAEPIPIPRITAALELQREPMVIAGDGVRPWNFSAQQGVDCIDGGFLIVPLKRRGCKHSQLELLTLIHLLFADLRCSPSCKRAGLHGTLSMWPPDCFRYKGTFYVFNKMVRQVGFARLWKGTNAALPLAVPTVGIYLLLYDVFRIWLEEKTSESIPAAAPYAPLVAGSLSPSLACMTCYPVELARTRMQAFKGTQHGMKAPGVLNTLLEALTHVQGTDNPQTNWRGYRLLWTGMGAQLALDVPFSGICSALLEPMRINLLSVVGDDANVASVHGANFSAGFIEGSVGAAATCPLDVAKTRRQIEMDPVRALRWRNENVGIVVAFYEVVKCALHSRYESA
ncbi:unnamed protein product [Linum tenue]|uniref:Mitochondrial carrier protein n=1 Tax=Linum tenue TaxID=586396 RepID=A0AAV0JLD6_9ROSI|nr:unnamed protein product [Linum tenue]